MNDRVKRSYEYFGGLHLMRYFNKSIHTTQDGNMLQREGAQAQIVKVLMITRVESGTVPCVPISPTGGLNRKTAT